MNKIYQARVVKTGADGQPQLLKSTSVYANDPLTAKVAAAEQLGVTPDDVIVDEIPGIGNPTDQDMQAIKNEAIQNLSIQVQNQQTTGGGAYG